MADTALKVGKRVWVNTTRYKNRPGIVFETQGTWIGVQIPIPHGEQVKAYREVSLRVMLGTELLSWMSRWEEIQGTVTVS